MALLVIEVDTPTNGDLMFAPAMKKVRGRFDARRLKLKGKGDLLDAFPDGIPGQRIELDEARGTGAIIEPIHDPAHAKTRKDIEKLLSSALSAATPGGAEESPFDAARREFPNAHGPSWAYWMQRAVQAGYAQLVSGKFAESYPDAKKSLYWAAPPSDPREGQVKRLQDTVSTLIALLLAGLPAERRKEVERVLAGS